MKKLEKNEMDLVNGGSFCTGVGAVDVVYGAGVLLNLWNPVGWGGAAALVAMNGYCVIKSL